MGNVVCDRHRAIPHVAHCSYFSGVNTIPAILPVKTNPPLYSVATDTTGFFCCSKPDAFHPAPSGGRSYLKSTSFILNMSYLPLTMKYSTITSNL